jgi:EEF1A N-terminal glycine/lysine methyltransferase
MTAAAGGIAFDSEEPQFQAVPEEYLPVKHDGDEWEIDIFASPESSDDGDGDTGPLVNVAIAGHSYILQQPPDKGTLFAHQVWSGSKLMARYIAEEDLARHKRTIEFGAGTALPSLVALATGSKLSIITDYPDEEMLQAIRETVGHNWRVCGNPIHRVKVVGHEWGQSVEHILQAVRTLESTHPPTSQEHNAPHGCCFDLALLSECLWMHKSHGILAKSLDRVLHPDHGMAILTYAHHIPGCEEHDDAFFQLCHDTYGFTTEHVRTEALPYMWDDSKTIDVHLKVIRRPV